jgi:hypothetical protein
MNKQNLNNSVLKFIENLELAGITFIRDYIQFLFDGPILNAYTLPEIKIENKIIAFKDFGYCDAVCSLIGKKIISADENEKEQKIMIKFESDAVLIISLKPEDRNCAEAVMLRLETEGKWNVW